MVNKIMLEVNRLHTQMQFRVITKEMIKEGGSKLFYDVFTILTKAIDEDIEVGEINNNVEAIHGILKLFNYPGYLGKNIFQPIGAPHTWIHCLGILDFMAEIAKFS